VAEDLIDAIVSGLLPADSVLPGEQALCEDFGVSRVVVREALKALEHKGLLIIRQGQGTVVAPVTRWDLLDSTVLDARIRHDDGLGLLVQARCALESELAGTAATRRTERAGRYSRHPSGGPSGRRSGTRAAAAACSLPLPDP
jgi:DNA-binding FadR family transcriptional regulator